MKRWQIISASLAFLVAVSGDVAVGQVMLPNPAYQEAQTMERAVAILKKDLTQDHEAKFLPLIDQWALQKALSSSLAYYEDRYSRVTPKSSAQEQQDARYFKAAVATYRQIPLGKWPKGASFMSFYGFQEKIGKPVYYGFGLRLRVTGSDLATPREDFRWFDLPLLDIWYGKPDSLELSPTPSALTAPLSANR